MRQVFPVFFLMFFLAAAFPATAADVNRTEAANEPAGHADAFAEFSKRFSEIKAGDAEAYYNLAVFCIDNDLPGQAEYLLGEAAKTPDFEKKAKRLLEVLTGEPDKVLYEAAFKHYESGYLAEAKTEVEMLKIVYPQSNYTRKARLLLRNINSEVVDKPYLLVNSADPSKIIASLSQRAEKEKRNVEDLKKEYFTDILKKAEYFADTLVAKAPSDEKKEEYLFYAIKCAEEVYRLSDDAELKSKAEDMRSKITKRVFTERPVSANLKNIDMHYENLYLVKDSGLIEDTCGKYIKEGEAYLKKAREASGDGKISDLVSAYKCFSFANAYTKSEKLKEETFRKMKLISLEKRKEISKKKTSN
ncbi:MAG: hypothetical protein WC317_02305 [Candidatus Omnitrophota bacterium]|jgi:hypothetical protein